MTFFLYKNNHHFNDHLGWGSQLESPGSVLIKIAFILIAYGDLKRVTFDRILR